MKRVLLIALLAPLGLAVATLLSLQPVAEALHQVTSDNDRLQVTDRRGEVLSITYQNRWNRYDTLPLYAMPPLLPEAFIMSEDKRFHAHGGVDWRARLGAVWQYLAHDVPMRGASSIPEQVVRMLHPRKRTIWSKWLEGFEAASLSRHYSKREILDFYLNQLPYGGQRRGVVQAARYYFDRDLATLTPKEILALVVLARAPTAYDLYAHEGKIDAAIQRLAVQLDVAVQAQPLELALPSGPVDASHFIRALRLSAPPSSAERIRTTLDASLQRMLQQMLDDRLARLARKKVQHAAALVVDHRSGDILAWVSAGGTEYDTVTTARQPGSTLKPFLYGAALAKGWTPATLIDDAPITEAVGTGLHQFRNYSQRYYGPVTLREALGNSLNTPALRTIRFVTPEAYLPLLHRLGFASLTDSAERYDEGLALGAGEVTLFELVQAYSTLAHRGAFRPLRYTLDAPDITGQQVFSYEVASLLSHILSDPWAREKEFGRSSILSLPVQTAVKTGTSSDYRDAWAVGYNHRYTVGLWMGNLDRTPMDGITGSTGPALTLRAVFAELERFGEAAPLPLSPALERHEICVAAPDGSPCRERSEYFVAGTYVPDAPEAPAVRRRELVQPTQGLRLAIDPRVPRSLQQFPFVLRGVQPGENVRWELNGAVLADGEAARIDWPLEKGTHRLTVTILRGGGQEEPLPAVTFHVK